MAILEVSNLKKVYRSRSSSKTILALDGVNLSIEQGEIFGVLGPNGAGKTTLLNCMALLLEPEAGEISIFGLDAHSHGRQIKKRLNMSSGNSNFPWCMTVKEIFHFYGSLYGLWGKALQKKIDEIVELLELGPFISRQFEELSTGSKQKLALGKALLNSPELLFLDEPTIGLDPHVAINLRAFIKKINQERCVTVLLTTHYMKEAEELSDRIAFLNQGKVLALGTCEELKNKTTAQTMEEIFLHLNQPNL